MVEEFDSSIRGKWWRPNLRKERKIGKVQGLVCRSQLAILAGHFNWKEQTPVLLRFCITLLKMQIPGRQLLIDLAWFKGTISPFADKGWTCLSRTIQIGSKAEHQGKIRMFLQQERDACWAGKNKIPWDVWVAQWLSICLLLRAWSWSSRIESHNGLLAWSLLLPLLVSVSLCLSWINK